jgi:UDP-3-O-[3-hydroxymyristoyl] glucosamine N-acyltransferase
LISHRESAFFSTFTLMKITAKQLSDLLNGTIEGDPDITVFGPSKIEEGKEGTISFLSNLQYEAYAYTTKASILLVSNDFELKSPISATLIRVEDVYACVAKLLAQFGEIEQTMKGVDDQAFIDPEATLGKGVVVGKFTLVNKNAKVGEGTVLYPQVFVDENVKIGKGCILYPGVKIYRDCEIGDHCILHANVVVGSDGFGFAPQDDGTYKKIPQIGNVIIEDQVEIGANTVIDRATMGSTLIKSGVKLDNLIQIAHNVEVGENTAIAAQAGIAGSTKIGKNCLIGGQAGFVGHITIADGTKVQAQSGINKAIKKEGTALYGSPAMPYTDYLRSYAVFRRLPDLSRQIEELKKEIAKLKEKE